MRVSSFGRFKLFRKSALAFLLTCVFVLYTLKTDQLDLTLHKGVFSVFEKHDYSTTFFVETSGATHLSHRQACAVEAAAKAHRPHDVVVYMTGGNSETVFKENPWMVELDNLRIEKFDPTDLFSDSKLKEIYYSKEFQNGKFKISHLSDMSRVAILKKYGGMYLDLDMILIRSALSLGQFVAKSTDSLIGSAVMRTKRKEPMISAIFSSLEDIKYDPEFWAVIGPRLFTKTVEEFCRLSVDGPFIRMSTVTCGVKILPEIAFFPYPWDQWRAYFEDGENLDEHLSGKLKDTYAVHVFNKFSEFKLVSKSSTTLFNQLAKTYCPNAYRTFPEIF